MESARVEPLVGQVAWLLFGAVLVGIAAKRLRVPYAVALVLAGLLVAESGIVEVPRLDPNLVLFAFLPPLLFEAAFRLDARELRLVARPVAWLALPGVLVTALLVGLAGWILLDLPFGVGLLFGSIVAATDPIAVIALLKTMRVPSRLAVIPEAESLVNDGMAITLYTALLGYATRGRFAPGDAIQIFGREVAGGIAIGLALAFAFSWLTATIDDHALEMMLSTALAYGSYLAADAAHASGPLACVAAGLIHGSYGRAIGMSANTSERLDDLWEYLGYAANAVVFLLVGFSADVRDLVDERGSIAVAVAAVLAARVLVVAGTRFVTPPTVRLARGERIVTVWAGMRGALTIALALALPGDVPHRELLVSLAFGVVLFTLVVQGLTLSLLVDRLGLHRPARQHGSH